MSIGSWPPAAPYNHPNLVQWRYIIKLWELQQVLDNVKRINKNICWVVRNIKSWTTWYILLAYQVTQYNIGVGRYWRLGGLNMYTARVRKFLTTPIFAWSKLLWTCSQEFLDERTNSKSSRVNLAATYSHIDSSSGLVGLRKSVLW